MRVEMAKPGFLLAGLLAASVCLVLPTRSADAGTIMVRVNAANDDAEEHLNDNSMDLGSSDLELGEEGSGDFQLAGLRFLVDIPQGTTILDARIQFTVDEGDRDSGPTSLSITGELSDNAAQFTSTAGDITGRAQTATSVAWNDVPAWDVDGIVTDKQRTTNFASVVQEIVDQPGWAAGNAMVILIEGTGERTAASFNGEQNGAPILIITTAGGPHERLLLRRVADGDDDAEQDNVPGAGIDLTSSDLELTADSGTEQIIGIRWLDVNIPRGSTITSAIVQFQHDETNSGPTSVEISGQKSTSAARFTAAGGDIGNRPLTDAFVEWRDIPPWTVGEEAGPAQRTPDISNIVQEIVNQNGWQSGNALVVLIEQGSVGGGERTAEAWNGDADAAALLVVRYVPPIGFSGDPAYAAEVDESITVDLAVPGTCNVAQDVTYTVSTGNAGVVSPAAPGTATFAADGPNFGLVIALNINGVGSTTLTATPEAGSPGACVDVTGTVEVMGIQGLDLQLSDMQIGEFQQADVTGNYGLAGNRDIAATSTGTVYTTDVSGIVNIDADGVLEGLAAGDVEVTATNGNASARVTITVSSPLAVTVRAITNTNDDVEEQANSMSFGSSDLEIPAGDGNLVIGTRFLDLDIPAGAIIVSATIQFQVDEVSTGAADARIFAESSPDAGPILPLPYRFSLLPATTASVAWSNIPPWPVVGVRGPDQQTPNFAAVVQEVIDLPGWQAGSNILILMDGTGSRTAEAFTGGEAELTILWTLPDGISPQPLNVALIDPPQDIFLKIGDLCNVGQDVTYTITSGDAAVVGPASQDLIYLDRDLPFQTFNLTAGAAGQTTITATPEAGAPAACSVESVDFAVFDIDSVTLTLTLPTMEPGDTQQAIVTGSYGLAGSRDITNVSGTTFLSSDLGVATVDANGLIVAVGLGTAEITATNNPSDTQMVVVAEQVTKIAFLAGNLNLTEGDQGAVDLLRSLRFSGDPGQLDDVGGLPPAVVVIDDEDFDASDIDARFDLLVGSSTMEPSEVSGKFRCLSIPFIYWEEGLNRPNREMLTSGGGARNPGSAADELQDCPQGIFVTDNNHPITQGLTLETCLPVYDDAQTQSVAFTGPGLAGGARVLAESEFVGDAAIAVAGPAGDPDIPGGDGLRADATGGYLGRRVFLWLHDLTADNLNQTGQEIFSRSVSWALDGVRVPFELASIVHSGPVLLVSGDTEQVSATGTAQFGCEVDVTSPATGTTYASSDETVATIDANGLLVAVGVGLADITATNGAAAFTQCVLVSETRGAGAGGGLVERDGMLHFDATNFDERGTQPDGDTFVIVPDEAPGLPDYLATASARCDATETVRYMQNREGIGSAQNPPWQGNNAILTYELTINNPGTYQIWLRSAADGGGSDSAFVRIREIDGPEGTWWRFNPGGSDSMFNWDGDGDCCMSTDAGGGSNDILYNLAAETYHLEIQQREDGWGLDEIILDSTGAFNGNDFEADMIPCSVRCPIVTAVSHVFMDPINITVSASDLPLRLPVDVTSPEVRDGFVTVSSSNPDVATGTNIQYAICSDVRCRAGLIEIVGAGTTLLTLSNDMGFDNGPSRELNVEVIGPPPEGPELVQIMGGVGSAVDTFTSPLGENVPFTTVDLDLSADSDLVSGPGTLTQNGGGNHTLTLDTAVPVGGCVTVALEIADSATGGTSTVEFTLCHLPLDVNQDGVVNIADITAWANEFNGARRAALVDTNGDGTANVGDATQVGNMWFGRPPASKPWNGESLP